MRPRTLEYFETILAAIVLITIAVIQTILAAIVLIPIAVIYFVFKLPSAILDWISWELHYFDTIRRSTKKYKQ